ncbi:hypothetical protein [Lichenifustis flavocetrariae]|uniref:Uncharacterized protein n=1 Tax=Lichenifustis flavocetrariae TaxID=2949735 RepID=A0AA42CL34_9HYPH|nr:hypothetical protein [Lichenifustis flavocetrariae]MCW6506905.1 hypothetical protein [Lichenifustis flavocetrariae]
MTQKTRNPASGVRVQGFDGMVLQACSKIEDSTSVPEIQKKWLVARFGLAANRARIVAELAWGGARG